MKQITLLIALILCYTVNYAQIISDNKTDNTSKSEKPKVSDSVYTRIGDSWIFMGLGYQLPKSTVKQGVPPFNKPLGMRGEESMENRFTYQLGIRNQIKRNFTVEAGLILDRFAQHYSFSSTVNDSSYSYTRDYTFVGTPVQLYYTAGKRLKFYIGIGLQPMMIMRNHLETTYADSLGNKTEVITNKKENMNFLNVSGLMSAGITFQLNRNVGFYFLPSYAYGFTNLYTKQSTYKEYLSAINFKFGIQFNTGNITGSTRKKTAN